MLGYDFFLLILHSTENKLDSYTPGNANSFKYITC